MVSSDREVCAACGADTYEGRFMRVYLAEGRLEFCTPKRETFHNRDAARFAVPRTARPDVAAIPSRRIRAADPLVAFRLASGFAEALHVQAALGGRDRTGSAMQAEAMGSCGRDGRPMGQRERFNGRGETLPRCDTVWKGDAVPAVPADEEAGEGSFSGRNGVFVALVA